jgi:hypothetical protein
MIGFMNIYEPYEPVWGVQGLLEKTSRIFFLVWCFLVFLGSYMFICFIKITMRNKIDEIASQTALAMTLFMNLMNIYEVRVYKRFFCNVGFVSVDLMNLFFGVLHKCS